jgi:hypothetical protein
MKRIAAFGLSALLWGCATYQMSESAISRAEKLWIQSSVRNYSYDLRVIAFSPPSKCAEKGVISVVVRDSNVTSYGRCAVPPEDEADQASIPGMFKMMREAKAGGAPGVKAHFDSKYGFPHTIEIVVMRWATDSTFTFHVSNFQRIAE